MNDEPEVLETLEGEVISVPLDHLAPVGHRALTLVESEDRPLALGGYPFESFAEMLEFAGEISAELRLLVRSKGLEVQIGNGTHIKASGWSTMLAMIGVVPVETSSEVAEDGVYTSYIELRRIRDGAVVGGASAECGNIDEVDRNGNPTWADRPAFARKSMSLTRAMGKASRLSYAWIVEMAGYAPRAAEEMPGYDPDTAPEEFSGPKTRYKGQWEAEIIAFLVGSELVASDTENKSAYDARTILDYSPFKEVPFGMLEEIDAHAWVYGWLEIKSEHPKMKDPRRAKIALAAWSEEEIRDRWLDWAVSQNPPEAK